MRSQTTLISSWRSSTNMKRKHASKDLKPALWVIDKTHCWLCMRKTVTKALEQLKKMHICQIKSIIYFQLRSILLRQRFCRFSPPPPIGTQTIKGCELFWFKGKTFHAFRKALHSKFEIFSYTLSHYEIVVEFHRGIKSKYRVSFSTRPIYPVNL